jgi:hypothetical protein
MMTSKTNGKELFRLVNDTTSEFFKLAASFTEDELNAKPPSDGWTAGQVIEHVTRSNINITKELLRQGKICDRAPDAGVDNIKSIFLNFEKKLKSPAFIVPTKDTYSRETLIAQLKKSIDELEEAGQKEDLYEVINHAIFGDVTRLETLYFVVYHTKRHVHQLSNIQRVAQNEKN